MKVKLLYFAKVREVLSLDREEIDLVNEIKTVADLVDLLKNRGIQWRSIFEMPSSIRVAVNQELVETSHAIKANDEVAFFPPITGG
jgi:molybdopterin synthase sulfur carrier subunit